MGFHAALLDLALAAVALGLFAKTRAASVLAPPAVVWMHVAVVERWIVAPSTTLAWGTTAVVVGFALLMGSLGVGYWVRDEATPLRAGTRSDPPHGDT